MRPRYRMAQVRERPWRGSAAHIMFLASKHCWVSSGTVSARYCCEPRDVSGEKPIMKKCRRGNGIMFTASLRRSQLSWPGKRRQHVVPESAADTRWLRSPYVGVVNELVHGERGVVRLDHGVRHLGRRAHRVGGHDAVRVLLADLRDQERAHAGAGAAAQRVRDLEALQAIAGLGLLAQ